MHEKFKRVGLIVSAAGGLKVSALLFLLLPATLWSSNCAPRQEPNPEIIGDASWYDENSLEQKQYLIDSLKGRGDFSQLLSWPPDHLRRTIDISLDLTGSGYQRQSMYQGSRMPLTEHNIRKLINEYLVTEIRAGDRIILRIYGSLPGGEKINVDETHELEIDRATLEVDVRNPSRKPGHVQIIVRKISLPDIEARKSFTNRILDWFLVFVRRAAQQKETFEASPLLQHIRNICTHKNSNPTKFRQFIFVTDGHFHLGRLYYDPSTYLQKSHSIDRIKATVINMQIRPFNEADPNTKVLLFGLTSDGDEGFRQAQKQIFDWFFSPQPVDVVANQ